MEGASKPEKSKIEFPELREQMRKSKESMEEIDRQLTEAVGLLKDGLEILDEDIGYLGHMEDSNEFRKDYMEAMGKDPETTEYSPSDIEKVKKDIENTKELIAIIHEYMTILDMDKITYRSHQEKLETLEKSFKEKLLKIPPKYLN